MDIVSQNMLPFRMLSDFSAVKEFMLESSGEICERCNDALFSQDLQQTKKESGRKARRLKLCASLTVARRKAKESHQTEVANISVYNLYRGRPKIDQQNEEKRFSLAESSFHHPFLSISFSFFRERKA